MVIGEALHNHGDGYGAKQSPIGEFGYERLIRLWYGLYSVSLVTLSGLMEFLLDIVLKTENEKKYSQIKIVSF